MLLDFESDFSGPHGAGDLHDGTLSFLQLGFSGLHSSLDLHDFSFVGTFTEDDFVVDFSTLVTTTVAVPFVVVLIERLLLLFLTVSHGFSETEDGGQDEGNIDDDLSDDDLEDGGQDEGTIEDLEDDEG